MLTYIMTAVLFLSIGFVIGRYLTKPDDSNPLTEARKEGFDD